MKLTSIRNTIAAAILAAATSIGHAEPVKPAKSFATTLAKDCFVLEEDKLAKIPEASFKDTKIYIVYYSHLHCGYCVAVTKKLNTWHEQHKDNKDFSLVFATRGEKNNKELLTYLKKSAIHFPALDTKHYMDYIDGKGEDHAFYFDADDGVPRFRFFDAEGNELDPRIQGVADVYKIDPDQLDEIAASMMKGKEQ